MASLWVFFVNFGGHQFWVANEPWVSFLLPIRWGVKWRDPRHHRGHLGILYDFQDGFILLLQLLFFFGGKFWKPVWKFVGGTDHKAGKINHKPTFCCLKMPEARPCWSCVVMKKLLGSCVLTLCFLGLPRPWSCLRIRRIFGGQYFFLRWRFASPRKVIS